MEIAFLVEDTSGPRNVLGRGGWPTFDSCDGFVDEALYLDNVWLPDPLVKDLTGILADLESYDIGFNREASDGERQGIGTGSTALAWKRHRTYGARDARTPFGS